MLVEHNRSKDFADTLESFLCQSYIKQGEALVRGGNCPRGVYPGTPLQRPFSRGIAGEAFVLLLCPSLVSPDSRGWHSRMKSPVAQAEAETILCRTRGYVLKLILLIILYFGRISIDLLNTKQKVSGNIRWRRFMSNMRKA